MGDSSRFRREALGTIHGFIASGFGSGLAPQAPGTVGTVAALPLWWLLVQLPPWGYGSALAGAFLLGVWATGRTGEAVDAPDHGGMVWDEFVGLWVALALVPVEGPWIIAGFALFRAFDVLKPPPIRQIDQHLHGGFGVMVDDVVAGLYTLAVLYAAGAWLG